MAALTGGITAEGLVHNITTVAIQPVINDEHAAEFVSHVLNSFKRPVQANIITADIRNMGLNLSAVPLDEVLDFRKQYGAEFRSYVRDLRSF